MPFQCTAFTSPKDDKTPNEDRWAKSPDGKCFAVSDGATVSFDPAPWAEILCNNFITDPSFDSAWLLKSIDQYNKNYDREQLSWPQQAAFDNGSFATLLGVKTREERPEIDVLCFGDSIAVILDDLKLIQSFKYKSSEEFDHAPILLSTQFRKNPDLNTDNILEVCATIDVSALSNPSILLMTDALGRWFLENHNDEAATQQLLAIASQEEFENFVQSARADGRLRKDDTTLMVLRVSHDLSAAS